MQKALKENAKMRETQEKIKRAKEAKEKAEREKKEKKLRQAALLDMTTGGWYDAEEQQFLSGVTLQMENMKNVSTINFSLLAQFYHQQFHLCVFFLLSLILNKNFLSEDNK